MNDREEITEYNKRYYKYEEMMKEFPILYRQRKLPMTQTCMCWGIECGVGWYEPILGLSTALEAINVDLGKRWGFRIEAEQVKQKYGTLRFYWSVRPVAPWWRTILSCPFGWLSKNSCGLDATGAELKVGRFLYNVFFNIEHFLRWAGPRSKQRETVIHAVGGVVRCLVSKCEGACFNLCEDCGCPIGRPDSPRYATLGWVSYLCEGCAEKTEGYYTVVGGEGNSCEYGDRTDERLMAMRGKIFRKGKDVTAEYTKEREARNKQRYEEEKKAEKEAKNKPNSAVPRKKTVKKAKKA